MDVIDYKRQQRCEQKFPPELAKWKESARLADLRDVLRDLSRKPG
jgi:hypothetical protein